MFSSSKSHQFVFRSLRELRFQHVLSLLNSNRNLIAGFTPPLLFLIKLSLDIQPHNSLSLFRLWILSGGWIALVFILLFAVRQFARKRYSIKLKHLTLVLALIMSFVQLLYLLPFQSLKQLPSALWNSSSILLGVPFYPKHEFLLQTLPIRSAEQLANFDTFITLPVIFSLGLLGSVVLALSVLSTSSISLKYKLGLCLLLLLLPVNPITFLAFLPETNKKTLNSPLFSFQLKPKIAIFSGIGLAIGLLLFLSPSLQALWIRTQLEYPVLSILNRQIPIYALAQQMAKLEPDWQFLQIEYIKTLISSAITLSDQDLSTYSQTTQENLLKLTAQLIASSIEQSKNLLATHPAQGYLLLYQTYSLLSDNPEAITFQRAALIGLLQNSPQFLPAYELLAQTYDSENPKHAQQIRTLQILTLPEEKGTLE